MAPDGSPTVVLVDYGAGNRRSVEKAMLHVGVNVTVSSDAAAILAADGVLLPGVGAFPAAAEAIERRGLGEAIREAAERGTPILGTCLGMQLLFDGSTELGGAEGLGVIAGQVSALDSKEENLPHVGWNSVRWTRESRISEGLDDPTSFYHVHSFVATPSDASVELGWSSHGSRFTSAVEQGNVFGVQFHPEKSSGDGLQLLANFGAICTRLAS